MASAASPQSSWQATDRTEIVGRRIGAALIDGAAVVAAFVAVGVATGNGHAGHGHAGVFLGPTGTLAWVLLSLGYFFVCEALWGQTLGKRLLHIRVTTIDGGRASAGRVFIRTFLRLIDGLPLAYIVGLVSIIASGRERQQRLGDLAASTTVRPVD